MKSARLNWIWFQPPDRPIGIDVQNGGTRVKTHFENCSCETLCVYPCRRVSVESKTKYTFFLHSFVVLRHAITAIEKSIISKELSSWDIYCYFEREILLYVFDNHYEKRKFLSNVKDFLGTAWTEDVWFQKMISLRRLLLFECIHFSPVRDDWYSEQTD